MFDSRLPISYYREIGVLNRDHGITIVQHRESGKIFVQKQLRIYSLPVYEALYRLNIPNTPRIHAMYEGEGGLTVIEEYISGDTLEEILRLCGTLPEADVIRLAVQLCGTLGALHTADPPIIHRDIKPANVMVTEDGRAFLLDFNAAKLEDRTKGRDTKLLGTQGYAAPEQYGFGASSAQTDLYGLGCLMETLLGGKQGRKMKRILSRCTALDPGRRFRDAEALQAALLRLPAARSRQSAPL